VTELEYNFADAIAVSGQDLRFGLEGLQEGVIGSGDLKCVPGAGLTIDVPAGVVLVQGDSINDQGLYRCRNDATKNTAAFTLGGIPAAHATLPRIDQIIARCYDHAADASGLRLWRLEVLAGTATAGATLSNRNGAAALPASACRLLDVLTPAAFAGPYVAATHFLDRRPWARGACVLVTQQAGADYTIASTTAAEIDATNIRRRLETSGNPVRMTLSGMTSNSVATGGVRLQPRVDGVVLNGSQGAEFNEVVNGNGDPLFTSLEWIANPAAGSHLFSWWWSTVVGGTASLERGTDRPIQILYQELVTQSASND
jgi:hypothetical protein